MTKTCCNQPCHYKCLVSICTQLKQVRNFLKKNNTCDLLSDIFLRVEHGAIGHLGRSELCYCRQSVHLQTGQADRSVEVSSVHAAPCRVRQTPAPMTTHVHLFSRPKTPGGSANLRSLVLRIPPRISYELEVKERATNSTLKAARTEHESRCVSQAQSCANCGRTNVMLRWALLPREGAGPTIFWRLVRPAQRGGQDPPHFKARARAGQTSKFQEGPTPTAPRRMAFHTICTSE